MASAAGSTGTALSLRKLSTNVVNAAINPRALPRSTKIGAAYTYTMTFFCHKSGPRDHGGGNHGNSWACVAYHTNNELPTNDSTEKAACGRQSNKRRSHLAAASTYVPFALNTGSISFKRSLIRILPQPTNAHVHMIPTSPRYTGGVVTYTSTKLIAKAIMSPAR